MGFPDKSADHFYIVFIAVDRGKPGTHYSGSMSGEKREERLLGDAGVDGSVHGGLAHRE